METDIASARLAAFRNVQSSIDVQASLPAQVLVGDWSTILFFESDWIFSTDFVPVITDLLFVERGISCCLLNFTQTHVPKYEEAAAIFVETATLPDNYVKRLMEGGPANGWLYRVDRYGCASDIGEWCIYCERENDVALIGLRGPNVQKFLPPLERFSAKSIDTLVQNPASPPPFNTLTRKWRIELVEHYGRRLPR